VQNRDGNLNVPYLYENGDEVVLNWNWLDNDWNDNNLALRHATRSFLLGFVWGVLFCKLAAPAAQISADLVELRRKRDILLVVKGFRLPQDHEQYPECVELAYGETNIRVLFLGRQETGGGYSLDAFNKQRIYAKTERISVLFW